MQPDYSKWTAGTELHTAVKNKIYTNAAFTKLHSNTPPQLFYDPFSGTTRVSRCQKRTSGLYGARED